MTILLAFTPMILAIACIAFSPDSLPWFIAGFIGAFVFDLAAIMAFHQKMTELGEKIANEKIEQIFKIALSGVPCMVRFVVQEDTPDGPLTSLRTADVCFKLREEEYHGPEHV